MATKPCPCCSGQPFAACCEPYLKGAASAPTAEALMRSRFSAFHERKPDYILATDRRDASTPSMRADLRSEIMRMEWMNLIVLDTKRGGPEDATGEVTFVAAFRPHMPELAPMMKLASMEMSINQIHERSRFEREDGHWVYVSGEHLAPYESAPNAPCWCGRGKKTKHCRHPEI